MIDYLSLGENEGHRAPLMGRAGEKGGLAQRGGRAFAAAMQVGGCPESLICLCSGDTSCGHAGRVP